MTELTSRMAISTAILAVTMGALLPVPAAAATTPLGTWDGTVQVPGDTHDATFSFTDKGVACLGFGTPDQVHGSGVGTWWATGTDHFSFHILHDVLGPTGTLLGWVDVSQGAVQDANSFTSSGTSLTFDPDGNQTGSVTATVRATRTSGANPNCGQ
jgi:hypothetical protein